VAHLLQDITEPQYETLTSWWDAWPEARPAHLDFWARGNYSSRVLNRARTGRSSLLVRVAFLDELESALKRLALLDSQIDFVWCGSTSGEQLVIVPQDVDYEGNGGWGYNACAGDEIADRRGGKEWCPSVGWASLLPDSVTDWLADKARPYVETGRVMVCPAGHIGLTPYPGGPGEENLQRISNAASILRERAKLQTLFRLELPCLEGMSIADVYRFTEDQADSLLLFRNALSTLLTSSIDPNCSEMLCKELVSAIDQGVAELRLSDRALRARRTLAALGAGIGTFLVTLGVKLGVPLGSAAIGSTAAAIASINLFAQTVEAEGAMRKSPFYAIWALEKGKRRRGSFRNQSTFMASSVKRVKKKDIPPFHWMGPPSAGWNVPTAFVP